MSDIYVIQPVIRSLKVLETVAAAPSPMALKDVVAATGFPKTTAFKHIHTLRAAGYLALEPGTDRVRLGIKMLLFAGNPNRLDQLRDIARPVMEALRDRVGETINLGVLEGQDIVYLAVVESRQAVRTHGIEGARDPAYSTAIGRAILARLPEPELIRAIPAKPAALTAKTNVARNAILKEVGETAARGYAIDDGESESDVRCLGAAIMGSNDRALAALSISGPRSRFTDPRMAEARDAILRAAEDIGQSLQA